MEELGLDYKLERAERLPNGAPPPEFTAKIPTKMKNSPTIKDDESVVEDSLAITEYVVPSLVFKMSIIFKGFIQIPL